MALSVDWTNRIINIPRADMALIQATPTEIREQSLVTLFNLLREQEASDIGVLYPSILEYTKPLSLGGVTLAPAINIINNYTITFEDGQYAVNLVGANSNVADKVNVNQVSVRSANSAGLVQTREIEQASYNGGVTIDTINGTDGTNYPIGTPGHPCKTIPNALFISQMRGFTTLYVKGSVTLSTTDFPAFDGGKIVGNGHRTTIITLDSVVFTRTIFEECHVQGVFGEGSNCSFKDCIIDNTSNVIYDAHYCGLKGTIQFNQTADTHFFEDCYSTDVNGATTFFDFAGSDCHIACNRLSGKFELKNMAGANGTSTMNMAAGKIIVGPTCTTGTIKVRGAGYMDNRTGGTTVDDDTVQQHVWLHPMSDALSAEDTLMAARSEAKLSRQMQTNRAVISSDGLTVTIYADDGTTILYIFDVSSDKNTRTPR